MATVYKKDNQYYICVTHRSKRIRRSLRTNDYSTAKKLAKELEPRILLELFTGKSMDPKRLSLNQLIYEFLSYDHGWSDNTKRIYRDSLRKYVNEGFPENKSYRAMVTRCLNRCYRWGKEQGLIDEVKHFRGGNDYEARIRVFKEKEIRDLLEGVEPSPFRSFVRFAYYTGARQGEIRRLTPSHIKHGYVIGKVGKRKIKITEQARQVLDEMPALWNYSRGYVCKTFRDNVNRLKIEDARFHDLRRTFGLNLIRQGMSIFQVSKLLGHQSVTTTERHYAPLLATDIDDFKL